RGRGSTARRPVLTDALALPTIVAPSMSDVTRGASGGYSRVTTVRRPTVRQWRARPHRSASGTSAGTQGALPGGHALGVGLRRSTYPMRAFRVEQTDPHRFYRLLAEDSLNTVR